MVDLPNISCRFTGLLILGCLEKRSRQGDDSCLSRKVARALDDTRETPPLWNPQESFAKSGDDEAQMIGQGLCRREAALEWHADEDHDKESVL